MSDIRTEENRKDKEDFESDFSEMVNYSGAVMMIGGAAVLVSGFVVKSVGSSRLRRARRYQRKLDRYKMKKQLVDSMSQDVRYVHARGPRQQDISYVEQWLQKIDTLKTNVRNGNK